MRRRPAATVSAARMRSRPGRLWLIAVLSPQHPRPSSLAAPTEAGLSLPGIWGDPVISPDPQLARLGSRRESECPPECGGVEGFQKSLHVVQ